MANKPVTPRLTAGEMEIMDMLWARGAVALSEAHQTLAAKRPIGYTTVQTRLNRLVDKGVVTRTSRRPAQYAAAVPPDAVGARHLDVLLEKIAGFRIVPLVAHLIRDRRLTGEEIAELKRLIAEVERSAGEKPR
jgi:predicted transcriptional regulator